MSSVVTRCFRRSLTLRRCHSTRGKLELGDSIILQPCTICWRPPRSRRQECGSRQGHDGVSQAPRGHRKPQSSEWIVFRGIGDSCQAPRSQGTASGGRCSRGWEPNGGRKFGSSSLVVAWIKTDRAFAGGVASAQRGPRQGQRPRLALLSRRFVQFGSDASLRRADRSRSQVPSL